MAEWPQDFHPMRLREVPTEQGGTTFVEDVDVAVTVPGYQLRPDTWVDLAAWCGGVTVVGSDGCQEVAVGGLDDAHRARLGDYVMRAASGFVVDRGPGHVHRWWPAATPVPEVADEPPAGTAPEPARRLVHDEP